jgi:DnaJ-class molecular chaperone
MTAELVDYDDWDLCGACYGSGEGPVDGSRCRSCSGTGQVYVGEDDELEGPDYLDDCESDRVAMLEAELGRES